MFVSSLTAADSMTCCELLVCIIFSYGSRRVRIDKNKMHTKYSRFTVCHDLVILQNFDAVTSDHGSFGRVKISVSADTDMISHRTYLLTFNLRPRQKRVLFPVARPTHYLEKIEFLFAQHSTCIYLDVGIAQLIATTLAKKKKKKTVAAEIFMRLIRSAIT